MPAVAPVRDVTRVLEVAGPRGGLVYVLVLACGHWSTRRTLPGKTAIPCIGCVVAEAVSCG